MSVKRRIADDRGSSVVEFVLISVLLVMLLFGVLQIATLFYVRSVVASAASDGARYAANAGVSPSAGGQRATQLISRGLGASMARQLPCTSEAVDDAASGLATAQVTCAGKIRSLLLPIGAFVKVDVSARSLKDAQ